MRDFIVHALFCSTAEHVWKYITFEAWEIVVLFLDSVSDSAPLNSADLPKYKTDKQYFLDFARVLNTIGQPSKTVKNWRAVVTG